MIFFKKVKLTPFKNKENIIEFKKEESFNFFRKREYEKKNIDRKQILKDIFGFDDEEFDILFLK